MYIYPIHLCQLSPHEYAFASIEFGLLGTCSECCSLRLQGLLERKHLLSEPPSLSKTCRWATEFCAPMCECNLWRTSSTLILVKGSQVWFKPRSSGFYCRVWKQIDDHVRFMGSHPCMGFVRRSWSGMTKWLAEFCGWVSLVILLVGARFCFKRAQL